MQPAAKLSVYRSHSSIEPPASNYNQYLPSASIAQKALTVSGMTAADKVYDGNSAAALSGGTLSGLVGAETLGMTGQGGTFSDKNAATCKAVSVTGSTLVDGTGLASNYTVSNPLGLTASITQKALTVSGMSAADKVYDGNAAAALSGGTLSGLVGAETLGLTGQSGAFSDQNAANGKTVTVSGTSLVDGTGMAGNYTVSNPVGLSASINKKTLTVNGMTAVDKVYDGSTAAQLSGGKLVGLVGSETLGLAGQRGAFVDKNAASGKTVTVSGTTLVDGTGLASNYAVSNPVALTANITRATIGMVNGIVANNKVYDGNTTVTLNTTGAGFDGKVAGDLLTVSGASGAFSDKNAATGKTVAISGVTLTGIDAGNYDLASSNASASANIAAATLLVTASGIDKVYDGTLNAAVSLVDNRMSGDALAVVGGASFADKNAASGKVVSVNAVTLSGKDAANYVVGNIAATTANITPATLTVSATGVNKIYDASVAATVNLRDNRIGNDVLNIAIDSASFIDKSAGLAKAVTVNGIHLSGQDAKNYMANVTASTTANIGKATLTAKAGNAEKGQGELNPAFAISYTGFVGIDSATTALTGTLAYTTTATVASPSGEYLVTPSGQSANNYAIIYSPGVVTVNPTEALHSAVTSAIATATVAPSHGNMVATDAAMAIEPGHASSVANTAAGNAAGAAAPAGQFRSVVPDALRDLGLTVVERGISVPADAGASPQNNDDN